MSIKIITDSTSYIPLKLREKYDISVVSLNVIINDKSYREVELKNEEFYIEMDKLNDIPTSLPANGGNSATVGGFTIWTGTQTEYDSIGTKSNTTLYFIKEG